MRRGRRGRGVGGGRLVGGWVSGGDGVGVGNGAVGGVRLGMGYGHGVWGTGCGEQEREGQWGIYIGIWD